MARIPPNDPSSAKLLTSKTANHASDYYERAWSIRSRNDYAQLVRARGSHLGKGSAMKEKLTRQDVLQMLPAYVYGALEPEQMLACQSYLQNMADRNLLLQYRDLEEMATQLALARPHVPPPWIKEQLMSNVLADLNQNHNHKYRLWLIRSHRREFSRPRADWGRESTN